MPLPGGASDKSGNRYELLWTVVNMTRVLNVEKPHRFPSSPSVTMAKGWSSPSSGPAAIEYHQVKRQRTGRGVWPLSELAREGVLGHFYQKLDAQTAETAFVSTHAAHPLDELTDRARSAVFLGRVRDAGFWLPMNGPSRFNDLHRRWGIAQQVRNHTNG